MQPQQLAVLCYKPLMHQACQQGSTHLSVSAHRSKQSALQPTLNKQDAYYKAM
jgi:hypothetical protein